jgi:glycosyltransferase involved in cell wall biosynthesis
LKLLIFRSSEPLLWESCQTISSGLTAAYEKLDSRYKVTWYRLSPDQFRYQDPRLIEDISRLSEEIKKFKTDRLIFMDQLPLAPAILLRLLEFIDADKLPPIVIHVYGDFTYFAKIWQQFLSNAYSLKIQFVVASKSQERLLRYFCGPRAAISVCHFPVKNDMFFSEDLRAQIREKEGLGPEDRVLIYTGRLHVQKNVDTLITFYADHCRRFPNARWHLWIAGAPDDLCGRSLGIFTSEGHILQKIQKIITSRPESIQKRIKLWSSLDKNNLRAVLSAADLFASLSLYHDEDFGMAPAEALANGLPTVLTDWGGYSSFVSEKQEWDCSLLPLELLDIGYKIDFARLEQAMHHNQFDAAARHQQGKVFQNQFSPEAARILIMELLSKTPIEYGESYWKLKMFAENFDHNQEAVSRPPQDWLLPSKDSFYSEVYTNYISGQAAGAK